MKNLSKLIQVCEKFLVPSSCSFPDKKTVLSENSQPSLGKAFYSVPTVVHSIFKIEDKIICPFFNIKHNFFLYSITFLSWAKSRFTLWISRAPGINMSYCLWKQGRNKQHFLGGFVFVFPFSSSTMSNLFASCYSIYLFTECACNVNCYNFKHTYAQRYRWILTLWSSWYSYTLKRG